MKMFISGLLAALLFQLFSASTVFAADGAERRIIGYSPDGRWFAFEQFGINDGSGWPFHDIFVLDVTRDEWAKGTPVRILVKSETASLLQARNQARATAAPTLAKLKIVDPGVILASHANTEEPGPLHSITFRTHHNLTGKDSRRSLTLQEIKLPAGEKCEYAGETVSGFSLSLSKGDEPPTEVYADSKVPTSRGCPVGYGIADVITRTEGGRDPDMVVLIRLYRFGFEGRDTRYIAVPVNAGG